MKVRYELTKKLGLISLMKIFWGTISLRKILEGLKSNIDIFRGGGSFTYLTQKIKRLRFKKMQTIEIWCSYAEYDALMSISQHHTHEVPLLLYEHY